MRALFLRHLGWRIALPMLLITSLAFQQTRGEAVGPIITGEVSDILGNLLVGASVTDGRQTVTTGADGRYTIVETSQGSYTVTASKLGYVSLPKSVNTLNNTSDTDFDLKFQLNASNSPTYFNQVPQTLTLSATSLAPQATVVTAEVPNVGTSSLSPGNSGPPSSWSSDVSVPSNASDGRYTLVFNSFYNGQAITDYPNTIYILDRVAPTFGMGLAAPNGSDPRATRSATPLLSLPLTDDRAGIDLATLTAEVRNVTGTVIASGAASYSSLQARFQVPSGSPLVDGSYTATFNAQDRAGNTATTSFNFIVDTILPSVLFGYPNDDVATTTPEVGATITDSGPAALNTPTLSITGPGAVNPSFNTTNGRLTYTPTLPLTVGGHTATVIATDSAGNSKTLAFPFWVLQTLTFDQLTKTYVPTTPASPCSAAGTSLLTLFNGGGVSAMQIKHAEHQTKAADLADTWLFADPLTFSWSPTLGGTFLHEIFADGIPLDASQGVFAPGQPCGSPPDIHPLETTPLNATTHSRTALGPGGSRGAPVASGTYSWRVKDNVATQSTESDRLSVLSVVGKWPGDQDYFVSSTVNTAWIPTIESAAGLWGTASTFQYNRVNSCPTEGCDYVNQIKSTNMGSNGPLGMTQYMIAELGINAPDTLGCCFTITVNSAVPMSTSYPPQSGNYDLFSVMAHELGHGAGVGHDFTYPASVMNNVLGAQWVRRSLLPFDKNTMSYLYQ